MKKITLLVSSLIVGASLALASQATAASLDIAPKTATLDAGSNLNASVSVATLAEKVCTIEGKVEFSNMTCQNITLSGNVMAQKTPTCQDPNFTLGLAKCTTLDKELFTISVNAGNPGAGSISFSGVTIIGEGTVLTSSSNTGNYTVVAVAPQQPNNNSQNTGSDQNSTNQGTQTDDATGTETTTEEPTITENVNLAAASAAISETGAGSWIQANLWWLLLLLLIVAGAAYYYWKKQQKKQGTPN